MPGGFVGVDVFLVISGYLITSILLDKKAKADYTALGTLKYFYLSRFKRIAPAYFFMLVLTALVAAVLLLPEDFATFKEGLEQAASFNSNHFFADFGDYFAPANHEQPLLHTWSLAVEMQFYLLAPFIILFLPIKVLKSVFFVFLVGFTLLAEYRLRVQGIEQATYYSLYSRLPEFFAGGLVALFAASTSEGKASWRAALGIAVILVSAILQPSLGVFPGIAALLPVFGSVLLLLQPQKGVVYRVLSSRGLVWIGALSYSLYLWHWPVLAFLRYYTGAEILDGSFTVVFVVLTFSLSLISYFAVEQFFRRKQSKHGRVISWSLLLFAILGSSQAVGKINAALSPAQLPIEYRRYADPESICHGKFHGGDCLKGDLSSRTEVLVLGDSHGAMLNHFFDYIGKELGFSARIITASNCVTIQGFDVKSISRLKARESCEDQIEESTPFLRRAEWVFIAGLWDKHVERDRFNTALKDFIAVNGNKNIVVLSQVPRLSLSAKRFNRFASIGLPAQIQKDMRYQEANRKVHKMVEGFKNARFEDWSNLAIFTEVPIYQGRRLYFDEHHLNEVGSLIYARAAKKDFNFDLNRVAEH